MTKLLIHIAAAQLTHAIIGNLPDDMEIDIEIGGEKIRAGNSMTWEVHRIFYHAIYNTLQSDQWPTVKVEGGEGSGIAELLKEVVPIVKGLL